MTSVLRVSLLLLAVWRVAIANPVTPAFDKVTAAAGLPTNNPRKKYGGPTVVDLDRDGSPDLIFCHHDNYFAEVYYNDGGVFSNADFAVWRDTHGIVPTPISPATRSMRFSMSVGGAWGRFPRRPEFFEADTSRTIFNITTAAGVDRSGGRGRTAIYMDLSFGNHAHPDVIFMNAKPSDDGPSHFAYKNLGGFYSLRTLPGFEFDTNWYGSAVDIDGDRVMEIVVHYSEFTAYKLVAPFQFEDITASVFPPGIERYGVVAVAEFDYDNDGDFDLYVARTRSGDLKWSPAKHFDDYLFRNDGGKFVDVTDAANIPRGTTARGVTVADFNNDGHMDIFVTQYVEADIMLLNRGDGTFERVNGLISRPSGVLGDNAQAIDYDDDGMMDIISSQGDQHDTAFKGSYELFRNSLQSEWYSRYLKVRVGNAPDGSATPLHAVVTVVAGGGGRRMMRRVGTAGAAVSRSYVETLHFGLGEYTFADSIQVVWTSGYTMTQKQGTGHSQTITMGVV